MKSVSTSLNELLLLTYLIADRTARLAGRLARGLALAAAARHRRLLEIRLVDRLDVLHTCPLLEAVPAIILHNFHPFGKRAYALMQRRLYPHTESISRTCRKEYLPFPCLVVLPKHIIRYAANELRQIAV